MVAWLLPIHIDQAGWPSARLVSPLLSSLSFSLLFVARPGGCALANCACPPGTINDIGPWFSRRYDGTTASFYPVSLLSGSDLCLASTPTVVLIPSLLLLILLVLILVLFFFLRPRAQAGWHTSRGQLASSSLCSNELAIICFIECNQSLLRVPVPLPPAPLRDSPFSSSSSSRVEVVRVSHTQPRILP